MQHPWLERLRQHPIIAAVRDPADVRTALNGPVTTIFLLSGHLLNIADTVRMVLRDGRLVFVHVDLIDGLAKDQHGLRWLARTAEPTGIITTRASLISAARTLNLGTVQRLFLLDSQSVHTGVEQAHTAHPDVVEVLPGVIPDLVSEVIARTERPLIAGGLIKTVGQCRAAIDAGAWAVSTSDQRLWRMSSTEVDYRHQVSSQVSEVRNSSSRGEHT